MSEKIRDYLTLEEEDIRLKGLDFAKFQEDKQERDGNIELDAKTLALWGGIAIENSGLVEIDF